ncbi:MAG: glycoside hydrolase family 18 protein [Candidatus Dormibacteraeota bacterium]|uniref:Glycoside hydrolase family 18 protein n=1 Tax=Candidatus Dormiibacter inghamiae TaxID=3127013 RepID=A0A934KGJ7_9BACT|nr:glycoside hydrolase family 18 protein [Candidatus Dormibacteraeota bacterium]
MTLYRWGVRSAIAKAGLFLFLSLTLLDAAAAPPPAGEPSRGQVPMPGQTTSKPVARPGPDATKPAITAALESAVRQPGTPLPPRNAVRPLKPQGGAIAAGSSLQREVFGFVNAGNVGDPGVGYTTWDFSLLSTVAYFGLAVNADGSLAQGNTGWNVWHSGTASGLLNTAHQNGVRVVVSLTAHDQATLCSTLSAGSIQNTVNQTAANLLGADGVNLDYEGVNSGNCPDGQSLPAKINQLAQAFKNRGLGYLSIDAYAGAPEGGGFFDIPALAQIVDSIFVMAYDMDISNGPCSSCLGAVAPVGNNPQNAYPWNVTRAANDYAPWASKVILGFPYYGHKACVDPNPPPNAQSRGNFGADSYLTIQSYPGDPKIHSWSGVRRDALDPAGQDPWASFSSDYAGCWREEYWDDPLSLSYKYDLVNQRNFRGAGMFTLDYGGGAAELWSALASHFRGQTLRFGPATGSPSLLVNADGHLEAFGRSQSGAIVHSWESVWGSWPLLASGGPAMLTAPATALNQDGRGEVFATGSDGAIYHTWQPGWPGWGVLATNPAGVAFTGQPAAARNPDGRLEVFARGRDGSPWHVWQVTPNGGWSGWTSLGGSLTQDPTVGQNADGHLEVFGVGTDSAVYHTWLTNHDWAPWQSFGGQSLSKVGAARNSSGTLEIFVLGSDRQLYHQWQLSPANGGWAGWAGFGPAPPGGGQGDPAVTTTPQGPLDVFLRGGDNAVWHATQPNWSAWYSLGGVTVASPVAAQEQRPITTVWVNGSNYGMYENYRTSNWSGWIPRGGN